MSVNSVFNEVEKKTLFFCNMSGYLGYPYITIIDRPVVALVISTEFAFKLYFRQYGTGLERVDV